MSSRNASVHRIFSLALAHEGAARTALLQQQCGDDAALRAEVEALLGYDDRSQFLAESKIAVVRHQFGAEPEPVPERIGAFRVVEAIGRGGMGVVYRAVQDQPAREVALKVLAPGLGGAEARQRFAFEAEVLGRLQHPGIAQIHEAGSYRSAAGEQPYLAMELVRGVTLQAWAKATAPSLDTRVGMLVQIAEAVHHAHQKGVIHRDLKPGNVLVDADGRAKVLDFGVARLVDPDRSRTLQTHTGQLLGTLAYMSPEQANGDFAGIDVRSDVYALGAIAYELLGGLKPLDVHDDALTSSLRRIVEEEPVPLGALDKRLAGDLQTIVGKALRKEPDRRYPSAQAFADDLRRYLVHEPILARPATLAYVFRRFTRRHRGLVAGAALAVAALVLGSVLAVSWALRAAAAARQATEEARVATAVTAMLQGVLLGADPEQSGSGTFSAQEFLRRGREVFDRVGDREPLATARVGLTLGVVLITLGDFAAGNGYLQRSAEVLRKACAGDDPRLVEVLHVQAWALQRQGREREAGPLFGEALAMHRRLGPPLALTTAKCLEGLGSAASWAGQTDAAMQYFAEARTWRERDGDPLALAHHHMLVGRSNARAGRIEAAQAAYERAQAVLDGSGQRWPAAAAVLATNLGDLRFGQRQWIEASEHYQRAIERTEACFGPQSPRLLILLNSQSATFANTGQVERCEAALLRALSLVGDEAKVTDVHAGDVLRNLGSLRLSQRRTAEGLDWWRRALAVDRRLRPGSERHRSLLASLADQLRRHGDEAAADELLDELEALPPTGK